MITLAGFFILGLLSVKKFGCEKTCKFMWNVISTPFKYGGKWVLIAQLMKK